MNPNIDPTPLSHEQLLELVRQLIAENGRLRAENTHLREGIEQLKRKNARSAAPFSKNKGKRIPNAPDANPDKVNSALALCRLKKITAAQLWMCQSLKPSAPTAAVI